MYNNDIDRLIPNCANRADHEFIKKCLFSIPAQWREMASKSYEHIYLSAAEAESNDVKKANAARRAANSWLLRQHARAIAAVVMDGEGEDVEKS